MQSTRLWRDLALNHGRRNPRTRHDGSKDPAKSKAGRPNFGAIFPIGMLTHNSRGGAIVRTGPMPNRYETPISAATVGTKAGPRAESLRIMTSSLQIRFRPLFPLISKMMGPVAIPLEADPVSSDDCMSVRDFGPKLAKTKGSPIAMDERPYPTPNTPIPVVNMVRTRKRLMLFWS